MLYAGAFLAKIFQRPARVLASSKVRALACFMNLSESFAWYDQDSLSWKTYQQSFLTDWTPFSESWPRQGMTRNGRAFVRRIWEPATAGIGGGASPIGPTGTPGLPTPAACVANDGERPETWLARRERVKQTAKNGNGMGMPLSIAAQLLPTPTTRDWKDGSQQACQNVDSNGLLGREIHQQAGSPLTGDPMYLNPAFVEEMMGYEIGWTDLRR